MFPDRLRWPRRAYVGFHPVVGALQVLLWVAVTTTTDHPLLLVAWLIGCWVQLKWLAPGTVFPMVRMGLHMSPWIVLVNVLANPSGIHVLIEIPMPFGWIARPVTLEALVFGGTMALKILIIFLVSASWGYLVPAGRFSRWVATKAPGLGRMVRLVSGGLPRILRDMERLHTALMGRGMPRLRGFLWIRALTCVTLWRGLLVESLESAHDLAEAMFVRGCGLGVASSLRREIWSGADALALLLVLPSGGFLVWWMMEGQLQAHLFDPSLRSGSWGVWAASGMGLFLPPALACLRLRGSQM